MSDIETLRAERKRINRAIEAAELPERVAKARALVGKTFRYRNSSGSDRPKWWLWLKVVKSDAKGWLWCFTFETFSEGGQIRIEPNYCSFNDLLGGYTPVSTRQFNAAWHAMQKRIARVKP